MKALKEEVMRGEERKRKRGGRGKVWHSVSRRYDLALRALNTDVASELKAQGTASSLYAFAGCQDMPTILGGKIHF